jgi:kynurenine formamidase
VHKQLLGAGKYILENVTNLEGLPAKGSFILALPLKIKGGTEAPVRLIGLINHPA